jgi:hypothetical protein
LSPELGPTRPGCPDESTLALFVEGALTEEGRKAVWEHVSTCEDCEEVVGVAAHLLDDDESASAGGEAPTLSPHLESQRVSVSIPSAPRKKTIERWAFAAVGLAATIVIGLGVYRGQTGGTGASRATAGEIVALASGASLPSGWPDHGWSATRGAAGVFAPREVAFRAGAWMVDLQTALSARDLAAARDAASQTRSLLRAAECCDAGLLYIGSVEEALTRTPPDVSAAARDVAHADEDAAAHLDRDALALGRWSEAMRLAARARDRKLLAAIPFPELSGSAAQIDPQLESLLRATAAIVRDGVRDQDMDRLRTLSNQIVATGGGI